MTNAMLRNATPADQAPVLEVFLAAWTQLYSDRGFEIDKGDLPSLRIDATKVAVIDGEIVGFIRLNEEKDLLERIYVTPEHQHEGVGSLLIDAAQELGARELWVDEGNLKSRKFYENHGWSASGEKTRGYIFPDSYMLQYKPV